MMRDFLHVHWGSEELELRLKDYLGRKHGDTKEVVEQIGERIRRLNGNLAAYSESVGTPFSLAFCKSRIEKDVEMLAESNAQFRRLRKTVKEARSPPTTQPPEIMPLLPLTYELVTRHSASFHDIFFRTWSCGHEGQTHTRHWIKFLLQDDSIESGSGIHIILENETQSATQQT